MMKVHYTEEEKELLGYLQDRANRKIITNPKGWNKSTEYIVLDEDLAYNIEDDLLTGTIDDITATQLEIENASFYATLEQPPSHKYSLEERRHIVQLFWDWFWGKIDENHYRESVKGEVFIKLAIYKNRGKLVIEYY